MWKCNRCKKEFEEPNVRHTTYESYYGVGGEFGSSTPMELLVCPYCGDENIKEIYEEEDDEEEEFEQWSYMN